jgi:hypothetical protein
MSDDLMKQLSNVPLSNRQATVCLLIGAGGALFLSGLYESDLQLPSKIAGTLLLVMLLGSMLRDMRRI